MADNKNSNPHGIARVVFFSSSKITLFVTGLCNHSKLPYLCRFFSTRIAALSSSEYVWICVNLLGMKLLVKTDLF